MKTEFKKKHLIVIDDTGSPGNFNQSLFLKEDRKTLVAVFIHSSLRDDISFRLKGIVKILDEEFNIKSLHFKDLINKNNEYKHLNNDDVLFLMEEISSLISDIDLPYFVQTCNNNTLGENGIFVDENIIIDNLDFNKNEDVSLFLLISKIKTYLKKNYPNENIEIIMDQGRKENNQTQKFKILKDISVNSEIIFKSSKEYCLLQIADYFAYSINRMQMTAIKENKTPFDITVIEYISLTLQNQDGYGITMSEVDIENYGKDDYDYNQYMQRQIDGNLNKWKAFRK